MSRSPSAFLSVAILAGFVLLVAPGCKKPPAPAPPPAPEVRLQVTSVNPGRVAPGVPSPVRVYGSAFEPGATVAFSGTAVTSQPGAEVRVSDPNTIELTVPPLPAGAYDVVVSNPSGESATLRSGLMVKVLELPCRSVTVNFGFDVSSLNSGARSTLDGYMDCYQSASGSIKIEGHADERGTVDYNLALGQRRADAVKSHLVGSGVSGSRISTMSYGEERPAASGHNESAWSQNRRAEITASE